MRYRPLLLLLFVAACDDPRTRALNGLRGVKLTPVRAKPNFRLEDTDGHPFDFRSATHRTATLFDKRVIGLRGTMQDVNQILAGLGLPAGTIEQMPAMPGGPRIANYGVGHAAQVLAFTPDDSLRTEYPSGFTMEDWANDLPKLVNITSP